MAQPGTKRGQLIMRRERRLEPAVSAAHVVPVPDCVQGSTVLNVTGALLAESSADYRRRSGAPASRSAGADPQANVSVAWLAGANLDDPEMTVMDGRLLRS